METELVVEYESRLCLSLLGVADTIDDPEEMYVFSVIPRDTTDWG